MTEERNKTLERAFQAWPLLAWAATCQQTLTYGDLHKLTGLATVGVGPNALAPIKAYCIAKKYPPLTVIVVNADGMPGEGLNDEVTPAEVPAKQRDVYNFDWMSEAEAPDIDALRECF